MLISVSPSAISINNSLFTCVVNSCRWLGLGTKVRRTIKKSICGQTERVSKVS